MGHSRSRLGSFSLLEPHEAIPGFVTDSALRAGSVIELRCPSVCPSVCLSIFHAVFLGLSLANNSHMITSQDSVAENYKLIAPPHMILVAEEL